MSKLNNKGQTLIMFVILIPVVLTVMALVIDTAYAFKEKNKLDSLTKTIIKNNYEKKDEKNIEEIIKNLYIKNNVDITSLKIDISKNYIKIKNSYKIDSIFGKIIGIKEYEIKTTMKGIKGLDTIKITKE